MTSFIAKFNGIVKTVNFHPNIISLKSLNEQLASIFSIPISEFKLSYRDLENDEIELLDQLDFEYFLSLSQNKEFEVEIHSDFRQQEVIPVNPFKKGKELTNDPVIEIVQEIPFNIDTEISENILHALIPVPETILSEQNLKTLNECLSDADILTQLKQKVEHMKSHMETAMAEMKNELVRTKRKNSGIVSREIESTYIHVKICCNNCGLNPINGKRYKCIVCKNFELCEVCEENNFHSHHPMIRLVESLRGPGYYEELANLIKLAMGNLKTTDEFLKKKVLKSIFGDHVSGDAIEVLLNSRGKKTVEEIIGEFYRLLQ